MVATIIRTSGNALFGHKNYVLTASLGASSSVASLGVGQLQNAQGSAASAWQTPYGTTSAFLVIDAGVVMPWRLFGLMRSNLTKTAKVRWRLANNRDMSDPVHDTDWIDAMVQPGYQQHIHAPLIEPLVLPDPGPVLIDEYGEIIIREDDDGDEDPESLLIGMGPSDVLSVDATDDPIVDEFLASEEGVLIVGEGTGIAEGGPLKAQFCRLDINDPENPDLFLNIPFVYAGDAWEPGRQISSDSAWGVDSAVDEVVAKSGQEYPVFLYEKRRWEIAISALPDDEVFSGLAEVMRVARRGANILFVPFPRGDRNNFEAVYGRLALKSDVTHPSSNKMYRAFRASVTERL